MAKPTVAGLQKAFRDLDPADAAALVRLLGDATSAKDVAAAMAAADTVLETYGVEGIHGDPDRKRLQWKWMDEYWGPSLETVSLAIYLNVGDPYVTTLLYDTVQRKFMLTTWADWLEKAPKWYGIE